jgi:hypothetical protein
MATTCLQIIERSMRLLGIKASGETPSASEAQDALHALNTMLDQWSNEKLLIYTVINNLFTVTPGVTSYTIGVKGSGATWESSQATRPLNVQRYAGFIRAVSAGTNTDYSMDYYPNDRFQNIFQKTISTNYPYAWTCDWAYPIANIRIYPNPTISTQFGLTEYAQLRNFQTINDYCDLPTGYESAITYALAVEIAPEYGIEPSAIVIDKAREYRFNIKRSNAQPVLMTVDRNILTHGIYSIYGDR